MGQQIVSDVMQDAAALVAPYFACYFDPTKQSNAGATAGRMSPLCSSMMRVKVFHGTNSIICANCASPTFTRHFGSIKPTIIANDQSEFQSVDTNETLEASVRAGFAAFSRQLKRTLRTYRVFSMTRLHAVRPSDCWTNFDGQDGLIQRSIANRAARTWQLMTARAHAPSAALNASMSSRW